MSTVRTSRAARSVAVEALERRALLSSSVAPFTTTTLSSLAISNDTANKPQSKVWEHAGDWFTVLPASGGTYVWRLDGAKWSKLLKLSSSTSFRADVKDIGGDLAHVLLVNGSSTALASIQYDAGSRGYNFWSERPGLTKVGLTSGDETATLDVDGAGRLWVAADGAHDIEALYADAPYDHFSSPVTLADGVSKDDISAITSFPDGSIGVMWSDQESERFGFRTHNAADEPSLWSDDEVPASQSALNVGNGMADDHINLAAASDGTLYAAVKTSYDTSGKPKMALLVRRPGGEWDDLYEVDTSGTRPVVTIDEAANALVFVYTKSSSSASDIIYRVSPLDSIHFGAKQTLIKGSFNNTTDTRQIASDGMLFLATNSSKKTVGVELKFELDSAAVASAPRPTAPTPNSFSDNLVAQQHPISRDVLDALV